MHAANATELFRAMLSTIHVDNVRSVTDVCSPSQYPTEEATPGCTFELSSPQHNVVACKSFDVRWAYANAIHFFAATEHAEMLPRYNKHAARFLTGDKWIGAYGAIAMPQVQQCINLLLESHHTRRAVVSMGGPMLQDANRPACWSFLQFLSHRGKLDMLVYQRSLQLWTVMPYDVVVLTNLLGHVCRSVDMPLGSLRWTVGSLHCRPEERTTRLTDGQRNQSIWLSEGVTDDPNHCIHALREPRRCRDTPARRYLMAEGEVRT